MNIKDFSISKGMTINIGNFNSHRVEVGVTVGFDEADNIESSIEQITNMVNKKLATEINQFTAEHESKAKRQTLMEQE